MTTITRRTVLATSAAASAAMTVPFTFAATPAAARRQPAADDLCTGAHEWLSRRLFDEINRPGADEAAKTFALKTTSCPHCQTRLMPAASGLTATEIAA